MSRLSHMQRKLISFCITLVILLIIALVVFIKKRNEYKGKKIYLDTVVENKKYKITFTTSTDNYNGTPYFYVNLNITNTLNTDQKFTFKSPFFITEGGTKVTFKTLSGNGFIVKPNESSEYWFATPIYSGENVSNYMLHFTLNGYSYNLYTKNNS